MYCAKQRARDPESTGWFATVHVGRSTFVRPALAASPLIAAGVMSGVPVICCREISCDTVLRPLMLMTSAPMPKPMRTTAAIRPPISNVLRISRSFASRRRLQRRRLIEVRIARAPRDAIRARADPRYGIYRSSGLEQAVLERVAHEVGARREVKLLQDVRAVCLGGAH